MNSTEYKIYHESFMKNNHGSNAVHTFFCIFFTVQCTLLCAIQTRRNTAQQYLYEYFTIVLPLILAHTLLADYIYHLNAVLCVIFLYNIINIKGHIKLDRLYTPNQKRLQSITCLRGLTYLITACAILAVDFKDFPRYLAKTETYGYSLMDTGVGLFVLMSGLVHRELQKDTLSKIIKSNIKFVSILLTLGISRYVSIKQLDYHEHVTEYGVHWNFFITLACCKIIATLLLSISNNAFFLSIITISVHELLLYLLLQDWVFSDKPRLTLIDANREGISSNLGYVALYLFAAHLKKILTDKGIIKKLIVYLIFTVMVTYFLNFIRPASRTLANASYCMFLVSVLLIVITIFYFFEKCLSHKRVQLQAPLIISDINNNGLVYFLICNLLTGFVNIIFQPLLLSSTITFIILNIYMSFTLFVTMYLNRLGIKV